MSYDNLLLTNTLPNQDAIRLSNSGAIGDGTIGAEKISNLSVNTIDVSVDGYIKSGKTSFTDSTNAGWFMSPLGIYFGSASDSAYLKYVVGTGVLTVSGSIIGSTINIPNATTPLFSVDSSGNVIANSLSRKDFHIFTTLESLDGYTVTAGVTISDGGVTITTTNVNGNNRQLQKSFNSNILTWDKRRKIELGLTFGNFFEASQSGRWGLGGWTSTTTPRVCFLLSNYTIYGEVRNGTGSSTVSLLTLDSDTSVTRDFKIEYIPAISAKFYIDGVLKGTILQADYAMPTGTDWASQFCNFNLQTDENVAKTMTLTYLDFWQSN